MMTSCDLDLRVRALLRCPSTGQPLRFGSRVVTTADGTVRYPIIDAVPDLRRAPERLSLELPWIDPTEAFDLHGGGRGSSISSAGVPAKTSTGLSDWLDQLPVGARVIDVGCGARNAEGQFIGRGLNYVGVDVQTRGAGPDVLADGHNLPFCDEAFDVYWAGGVWEHLACPQLAAREAFRVLRPGGTVMGTTCFVVGWHDSGSLFHMSHAGLYAVLRAAGFEDIRVSAGRSYTETIPEWAFDSVLGWPWRAAMRTLLQVGEFTYTRAESFLRRACGRRGIDAGLRQRQVAGSLEFVATRPARGRLRLELDSTPEEEEELVAVAGLMHAPPAVASAAE